MKSQTIRTLKHSTDTGDIPVPGDVLEALDKLGVQVVRCIQNEAWAFCPGHAARLGRSNTTPNKWSINLETGLHSCFSCGFSGSFVTLVQEVLHYERRDAVQWVRNHGGVRRLRGSLDSSTERFQPDAGLHPWTEARLALFTEPPDSALSQRRVSAGSVEHYGVLWDKDRWVLPIRDPYTGSLWGYQEKTENGWVSNAPDRVPKADTLFGINCFAGDTVVLLESPLDCLRLYTAGISGGVSSFGVNVSTAQIKLLLDIAKTVVIALDNDEAGIRESLSLKRSLLKRGRDIRFFNYSHIPEAKDIGTFGVSDQDIRQGFDSALNLITYR